MLENLKLSPKNKKNNESSPLNKLMPPDKLITEFDIVDDKV